MARSSLSGLVAFVIIISSFFAMSGVAAAHGVVVSANVGFGVAELEFTDETGDVCFTFDLDGGAPDAARIHLIASGDAVADLQLTAEHNGTPDESCTRLAVSVVEEILADVDAYGLQVDRGDETSMLGVLRKPLPPGVEDLAAADAVDEAPTDADLGATSSAGLWVAAVSSLCIVVALVLRSRATRRRATTFTP